MRLLHLIYIHGFQGSDTTFQSFPTDLQRFLSSTIPDHLDLNIQSSLYPTYKSVKPISYATKNFLEWLSTQPAGPVILLGHSMGGLLAAEAATHASNNSGGQPSRIVGMIAFDTPYLGMHPHVVITGIASLFRDDEGKGKPMKELNDTNDVQIVDGKVTDDWDAFKNNLSSDSRPASVTSASNSRLSSPSPPSSSPLSFIDRTVSFLSSHADDPLVRWAKKHKDDPFSASKRWVVERFQFGSCMFDPSGLKDRYSRLVDWRGGVWVNYWTQTVPGVKGGIESAPEQEEMAEDEAIRHSDDVVDSLPVLPSSRPSPHLGPPPEYSPSVMQAHTSDLKRDTECLPKVGVPSAPVPPPLPPRKSTPSSVKGPPPLPPRIPPVQSEPRGSELNAAAAKALEKQRKQAEKNLKREQKEVAKTEKDRNKHKPGRHFIVLPTGLGQVLGGWESWDKVLIGGVEDEVAAHTGLFIRGQNLDYDGLVERVGKRVLGWCEAI